MLPPHRPQNAKMRPLLRAAKPQKAGRLGIAAPERLAVRNIRLQMRKTPAALRAELRILGEAKG